MWGYSACQGQSAMVIVDWADFSVLQICEQKLVWVLRISNSQVSKRPDYAISVFWTFIIANSVCWLNIPLNCGRPVSVLVKGLWFHVSISQKIGQRQRQHTKNLDLVLCVVVTGVHASQSSLIFSEGRQMLAATPRQFQRQERGNFVVRGLFGLGVPELVVIAGVAALIFGPKKLPEIGKSLGKTVKSFSQVKCPCLLLTWLQCWALPCSVPKKMHA